MFFREYFRVLIPILALLAIYRLVAVPFIEIETVEQKQQWESTPRSAQQRWWEDEFSEADWERNEPKVLETAQGILLFKEWDKLGPDRWRLHPLTILIPQADSPASSGPDAKLSPRRAMKIKNPQGAEIQFREAVDWTSGHPPPVVGGQMNGAITITSPSNRPDEKDNVRIETSDLRIDRRHIWTTSNVHMELGNSTVEGRDLSIFLDHDLLATTSEETAPQESPFSGLDHLELIYVDRVHIDLPNGGLFNKQATTSRAYATVSCGGAFHFDFHQSLATLNSDVVLRHIVEGYAPDTFHSHRLDLHFQFKANPQKSPVANTTSPTLESDEWSIDRIEAVGVNSNDLQDASRWVRLEAPSMQARGQGRWVQIHLDQGRIAIRNHLPGIPAIDSSQVYLQRESMQVWSPEIEYSSQRIKQTNRNKGDTALNEIPLTLSATSESSTPVSLGTLWAAGPGLASLVAEDGDEWRLSWAQLLQMRPDGDQDLLTIEGSASARSVKQGRFSADKVEVWLTNLTNEVVDEVAIINSGKGINSVIPDRLHASEDVRVDSPELRAQVTDMQVWFNYPEVLLAKQQLLDPRRKQQALLKAQRDRQFVNNPHANQPSNKDRRNQASPIGTAFSGLAAVARDASSSQPSKSTSNTNVNNTLGSGGGTVPNTTSPSPGRMASLTPLKLNGTTASSNPTTELPLKVTGKTLVAKIAQSSAGALIEDLAIDGMVTVTRDSVSADSPWPLTMTGSQLRLDTSENGNLDASIVGSPAKLSIGSGSLEGPEVRFNQRQQMVWIDHPGVFRVPPEALKENIIGSSGAGNVLSPPPTSFPSLIPSSKSNNDSFQWLEAPEIRWSGKMVFNGQIVRMDGGVDIKTRVQTDQETVWHIHGVAREMQVELVRPIEIAGAATAKAEISSIRLKESVDIKAAQTDIKGIRRSLEHLEVPELLFIVPEQRILGAGPGSLRSRRVGNGNPISPPTDGGKPVAITPAQRNPQIELQCLHLTFIGRMEGQVEQQSMSFFDRVETLIGPIRQWEDSLDVHFIDRLKIGQTMMTCDQLNVYNTANLSYNQTQIQNAQMNRDAAWEVKGVGHVRLDSVNEKGSYAITAQSAQYAAIHNTIRIEGSPRDPAVLQTVPSDQTGQPPFQAEVSSMLFNMKTGESATSISRINVDLQQLNAAKNNPPANPNNNPFGANNGQANPKVIPSPRDQAPGNRK